MMKIGFHYHIPAVRSGADILMPGYLGLFIDSLAGKCQKLVCFMHSPLEHEMAEMDYKLRSNNVELVEIGPHIAIPQRSLMAWKNRHIYQQYMKELDLILVRASTPLLPVINSVWKKPLVLLLVSDATSGLDNLPQPGWRKILIKLWANWYQRREDAIARHCLTFVNSQLLFDKLQGKIPFLILTRTTTLGQDDFYERKDTCQGELIRLLYAGRMTRIKGLFEIVEAMHILIQEGFNLCLDLVGMVDNSDPMMDDLMMLAQKKGLKDKVFFHGSHTAGSELLAYYRQADIYVIASKASSEGFPRTIWEAMASSMPVVATAVGSIPAYAGNACEIVVPKDVAALTAGIRKVLTNPARRQQMIEAGMALAQENTLEKRAEEMVGNIRQWISRNSR